MQRRAPGWRIGAALLMGGLVGPYISFSKPATPDVLISAAAVALPVLLSVALDRTLTRKVSALLWVGVPVLIVAGLAIAEVVSPGIWQAYASDAGYFSLIALALLAPFAAAFALRAGSRGLASPAAAIGYGALAWLGVGVHNIVIPYYPPLAQAFGGIVQAHSQAQRDDSAFGVAVVALVILLIGSVYLMGLGLAVLGGWGGGALRARMGRAGEPRC